MAEERGETEDTRDQFVHLLELVAETELKQTTQ